MLTLIIFSMFLVVATLWIAKLYREINALKGDIATKGQIKENTANVVYLEKCLSLKQDIKPNLS